MEEDYLGKGLRWWWEGWEREDKRGFIKFQDDFSRITENPREKPFLFLRISDSINSSSKYQHWKTVDDDEEMTKIA